MASVRIRYSILLPVVLGGALIALAMPRLFGGLPLSDPDPVLRALANRETVEERRLNEAARLRHRSLAVVSSGRTWYELGLVRVRLAEQTTGVERAHLLAEATGDTRIGLLANPAQPFAWTQLVQLTMLRSGDSGHRLAASYYPLAVRTGPETPELVEPRVELGLILWPKLDDVGRRRAREQIHLLAHAAPDRLATIARERLALREIRESLATEPELLARFDSAYRRLR